MAEPQLALCCMSHSPLLGAAGPEPAVSDRVAQALQHGREFVESFDPELVIVFGPDHYQGFRYEVMPPFCVGTAASAVGDYGTTAGALDVPQEMADALIGHLLDADLDVAMSAAMLVDHGISQPLEILLGTSSARPVLPIFINSVATPLGPIRRARLLGAAVGGFARRLGRRVLVVGSGGLSHDPPVPKLRESPPEVAEYLISRRRTPTEQRQREAAVLDAGRRFAAGDSNLRPLNPEFDRAMLDLLATGELTQFDGYSNEWITERGGGSAHEVRTWVAAHAALHVSGPYRTTYSFYEPVPEWIVGFAVTTALPC